ncbi:MAG: MMPL family transporter [Dermatophilaceae bacterium]
MAAVLFVIVAGGGLAGSSGAGFTDDFAIPGADSQAATDLLEERFPSQAGEITQVVVAASADGALAEGGASAPLVREAFTALSEVESVQSVTPPQTSPDGRIAFVGVQHDEPAGDLPAGVYDDLRAAMEPAVDDGLEVSYRGNLVGLQGPRAVPIGEVIGIIGAIVILSLLFRSMTAMAVSLVAALVSVVVGTVLLTIVSAYVSIPSVAPTLVVMLGLGAGIDYALFMVARFRDRLRRGEDPVTAAGHAAGSTGVAVLAAGAIVVISISALFVTGIPLIARMGFAAGLVVAICAIGAVTLVPALLAIVGRRVLPKAERRTTEAHAAPEREGRRARALAEAVSRRPVLGTVVTSVVLLAMAAPSLGLSLGNPDDGTRPDDDTRKIAYDRLAEGFGPGVNGSLLVAVDLPGDAAEDERVLTAITDRAGRLDDVVNVTPPQTNSGGDAAVITVVPESRPQDEATSDLVDTLRDDIVPAATAGTGAQAHVGGVTAAFDDLAQAVADRLLLLIGVVVGLSLVLLTILFRSIWLPLVSSVFNLLSIGAAYGVVTLAFQTETGARLLGVSEQPIISFVPMLMFAILFGLSMDYNVFLLSRVRELWLSGHGAVESVTRGIGATAGIISAAGAIMTLVFTGFILEDQSEIRMIGLGLATAVLVDVTLVRMVLSPAVLRLLGERAWWFPRWLRWLPRLDLEH